MTRADPLMINEHASQATSTDLLDAVPGTEGFVNTSRLSKRFVLLRLWKLEWLQNEAWNNNAKPHVYEGKTDYKCYCNEVGLIELGLNSKYIQKKHQAWPLETWQTGVLAETRII